MHRKPVQVLMDDRTVHAFEVKKEHPETRLDRYLCARMPEYSRTLVQRLIKEGYVRVNGRPAKGSQSVHAGYRVEMELPKIRPVRAVAREIPIDVLYEDDLVIVVNKTPDFVVHPAAGHYDDTLVNALLHHCGTLAETDDSTRPGLVHRIDKDTSGVVLAAKTEQAHAFLSKQFSKRTVEKEYLAIVEGEPRLDSDWIDKSIDRHKRDREKMAVVKPGLGREAQTFYRVEERFRGYAIVRAHPKTGRTHQIRVHLASIGHPIAGDSLYGGRRELYERDLLPDTAIAAPAEPLLARQALHAARLVIRHPRAGERMEFAAPLPADMADTLGALRRDRSVGP